MTYRSISHWMITLWVWSNWWSRPLCSLLCARLSSSHWLCLQHHVQWKGLRHTAQGEDLVKINDEWFTSVRPLHAKCPPQQSEQPENRANEQGHWQFRKRSPTAPIPVPSVITCSNWMNCWEIVILFYSFCIFHVIMLIFDFNGGATAPLSPPPADAHGNCALN